MSTEAPQVADVGGEEKRRFVRVPFVRPARFRPTFQQFFLNARVLNISSGGICFASDGVQRVATEVEFEVLEVGATPWHGTGVIRWIRKARDPGESSSFGIEISFLEPEAKSAMEREIADWKPPAPPPPAPVVQRSRKGLGFLIGGALLLVVVGAVVMWLRR